MNTKVKRNLDEYEDEEDFVGKQPLAYGVKQHIVHQYMVALDEDIKGPDYYRNIVAVLDQAGEDDVIEFFINSPGGRLDGLLSLLDGLERTSATTIARISGVCASAASIFALKCDIVELGNYANMLCHTVRFGVAGKGSDVESQTVFTIKQTRKLLTEAYKNFLTDDEIEQVIQGRELYLDADEIVERLENREKLSLAKEDEPEEEFDISQLAEFVQPQKNTRKKKPQ